MLNRLLYVLILFVILPIAQVQAQSPLKKIRMGIQSTNIGFLPFHAAYHKGFYREQGIDLETIFMSTQAVNAAFIRAARRRKSSRAPSTDRCSLSSSERTFARRVISRARKSAAAPPAERRR